MFQFITVSEEIKSILDEYNTKGATNYTTDNLEEHYCDRMLCFYLFFLNISVIRYTRFKIFDGSKTLSDIRSPLLSSLMSLELLK